MKRLEYPIIVRCPRCDESFDENKVEFLGISEDIMGRDRLIFVCPKCKKEQESYRYDWV